MAWQAFVPGALSALGGIIGGSKGASAEQDFVGEAMAAQDFSIKKMLEMQAKGMGRARDEFDLSMEELDKVGPQLRQELLARGAAELGQQQQNALGTGLTGTTVAQGQLRGSRAATQRALSEHYGRVAQAKAGMRTARSNQVYQMWVDRANIRQRTKYDPFLQNFQFGSMGRAGAEAGAGFGSLAGSLFSMFAGDGGGGGFNSGLDLPA